MIKNLIPKSAIRKINRFAGKLTLAFKKHLPDILVATGIVSGGGAIVMACVETTKVDNVLDNTKQRVEDIHTEVECSDDKELAVEHSKKELTKAYVRMAFDFGKLYLPAICLEVTSIACLLGGHKIMRKRNMELAAAYSTIFNAFTAYRKGVVDKYGEDVDYDIYHGTTTREVVDSETGEVTKIHRKDNDISDYELVFDATNPNYDINPHYCKNILTSTQQYANDLLYARGYVFLNDILEDLNMPVTTMGQVVGWCLDENDKESDHFVDLRINQVDKMNPDGTVDTIFTMDPNVDGTILYKLEKVAK